MERVSCSCREFLATDRAGAATQPGHHLSEGERSLLGKNQPWARSLFPAGLPGISRNAVVPCV